MLTVRNTQLRALAEPRRLELHDEILSTVMRRLSQDRDSYPPGYLARTVEEAERICEQHGLRRPGDLLALVDALLKDDVHPLGEERRAFKVKRHLDEQRVRDLHARLTAARSLNPSIQERS